MRGFRKTERAVNEAIAPRALAAPGGSAIWGQSTIAATRWNFRLSPLESWENPTGGLRHAAGAYRSVARCGSLLYSFAHDKNERQS